MRKVKLIPTVFLTVLSLSVIGLTTMLVSAEQQADEKRKCNELIENAQDVDPALFTAVLNCELNEDDETFAAAGGIGFDSNNLSQRVITGGDITLNSSDSGTSGTGSTGGTGTTSGTEGGTGSTTGGSDGGESDGGTTLLPPAPR